MPTYTERTGLPYYENTGPGSDGYYANILTGYPTWPKEYQKKNAAVYNQALAWKDRKIAEINAANAANAEKQKAATDVVNRKARGRSIGTLSERGGLGGGLINSIRGIGGIK